MSTGHVRKEDAERHVLLRVLLLNAGLATALLAGGLFADSSGLLANALDNTSDALTYAVSYFAVSRSQRWKSRAATITGVMLLVLAFGVTADAIRRFINGSDPSGYLMMIMALAAAAINAWCIKLLKAFRREEVNLRAAWTMSLNDFASNFGIVVAGILVHLVGNNWPDLTIALVIAAVALYGGIKTLRDASRNREESEQSEQGKAARR
ncbi:cation transporter [Noviherbaspirillum sp. Root189]|uniref:cation transporter n=1 Tax=Noviherbaspirillum sp. Root189 TaxID=1736487 RepID=UPI00070BF2F4|nr:cation transporter [Noviherbaspirillum sp. Root189]KRB67957.1 hypothetical protein ASE07_09895 [Noviherbaspirillum sp. Root189]